MNPVDAARVAPLSWPPTSDADARWLARVMHALAVELDACWRAHELVRSLGDELGLRSVAALLEQAASAGVVVADSSGVIDVLATHAPVAAAHLRAAGEHRRRALGVLRDRAWLARRGLLDRPGLRSALDRVLADLASAGRSTRRRIGRCCRACGCPNRPGDANRLTGCYAPTEQEVSLCAGSG